MTASITRHHGPAEDGPPDLASCRAGIARLNGSRGGAALGPVGRRAAYDHLAEHLVAAGEAAPDLQPWAPLAEERHYALVDVEVRERSGTEPARIVGHAGVFGRWSEDLGGFREQFTPGAFAKTIQEADIRATHNHDPNLVWGRNRAGTLALAEDELGLAATIYPPDTSWARDLLVTLGRGDVNQMSLTFRAVRDHWSPYPAADGLYERSVHEARLFDVATVTFPAYTGTDAAVRSLVRAGIPLEELGATLERAERGVAPATSERDILAATIETLTAYLPAAPATGHAAPQLAGRSLAHLLRRIELAERT